MFGKLKQTSTEIPLIDHSQNRYLDVCDFLVAYPEAMAQLLPKLEAFHVIDICLMFQVRGQLSQALRALMKLEYDDNKARGVAAETFRSETPVVLLVSAVMGLDNVIAYRQAFVDNVVGLVMQRLNWSPKALAKVLRGALKSLVDTADRMPEELVTVVKALHNVAPDMPQLHASLFFLRLLCPALAQPREKGGLDVIPSDLKRSLLELAKALQLIANRVDPADNSFCKPIEADLRKEHKAVDKFFGKIWDGGKGAESPRVTKSLEQPARATVKALLLSHSDNPEFFGAECARSWDRMMEKMGSISSSKGSFIAQTSESDTTEHNDTGSSAKSPQPSVGDFR